MQDTPLHPHPHRSLVIWLSTVCLTVFCMVVVGGVTRLTESGLSMVDWQPIMGTIPPLTEADWQAAFLEYKAFPQYQQVNAGMSLAEFKYIFYWEYGHRVLGRVIGLIFFVPFVIFLLLGSIPRAFQPKLWFALVLGGAQGLMGWYMVKSGLVDEPMVSHYRLAAHLLLALAILAFLSWLILEIAGFERIQVSTGFRRLVLGFCGFLGLQIFYGALVAGNRAGFGFNTYPLMNGTLLPDIAWQLTPVWLNLLDNNAMLQFVHRWLGASVLLIAGLLAAVGWRYLRLRLICGMLLLAVVLQFLLGVLTLLYVVPVSLASIHQAGACILVVLAVWLVYSASPLPLATPSRGATKREIYGGGAPPNTSPINKAAG